MQRYMLSIVMLLLAAKCYDGTTTHDSTMAAAVDAAYVLAHASLGAIAPPTPDDAPKPAPPAPTPPAPHHPWRPFHGAAGEPAPADATAPATKDVTAATPEDVTAPAPAETEEPEYGYPSYPVRGNWWSGCPDWRHLTVGEHVGKFDPTWLSQLSNAEVQSLHSDDHENKVQWDFVVRGVKPTPPAQAKAPAKAPAKATSDCPGGFCPTGPTMRTRRWGGLLFGS